MYIVLFARHTHDYSLLLRRYYQSTPLYGEVIYFDNNVNVDRGVFQSSMNLTYSVQSFLDSIVSSYDYREVFTGDPEEEEVWEVFEFEKVMLLNITRLHII